MDAPTLDVAIAYLHPGQVSAAFSLSLLKLMLHETYRTGVPPFVIANRCGAGNLVEGRNQAVSHMLDSTTCNWLLFTDSDMGFGADAVERLLEVADPVARPVVGGLCFALRRVGTDQETQAEEFRCEPTVYHWRELEDRDGFEVVEDYERDAVVQVGATGAAFLLMHRSVLERIRARYGDRWFDRVPHTKRNDAGAVVFSALFSEDISFCIRVAGVDRPLFVHTGVRTCHDKGGRFYDEAEWDRQLLLAGPRPAEALASA